MSGTKLRRNIKSAHETSFTMLITAEILIHRYIDQLELHYMSKTMDTIFGLHPQLEEYLTNAYDKKLVAAVGNLIQC